MIDLAQTIQAILAGHADRFESIVKTFEKPLYNFVVNRVHDPAAAEDLTQEAFLKAYRALSGYDASRSSFKTWLFRIGLNVCLDHFRRRQVREEGRRAAEAEARSRDGSQAGLEQVEQRDRVLRMLGHLAREDADVVSMRYVDGLEYEELAAITGLSAATLRSRVHRALGKLRERFGARSQEVKARAMQ